MQPIGALEGQTDVSEQAVGAYVAKYATKAAETTGTLDRRIGELRELDLHPHLPDHTRRLIEACWDLDAAYPERLLAHWSHMLGFRGHFSTKTRRYSTTLGALRGARADWRAQQERRERGLDPSTRTTTRAEDTTLVLAHWEYAGHGHTPGESWLAATIARDIQHNRETAREALPTDRPGRSRSVTTAPAELLTVPEVMARLKLGRSSVYDLIRSRRLVSITIGRCPPHPGRRRRRLHRPTRSRRLPDGRPAQAQPQRRGDHHQAQGRSLPGAVYVLQPDGTRARKFAYGKTWAECDAKRRELLDKIDQGVPVPTRSAKLSEWLPYWLDNIVKPRRKRTTYDKYEAHVRLYLVPMLGLEAAGIAERRRRPALPRPAGEEDHRGDRQGVSPRAADRAHRGLPRGTGHPERGNPRRTAAVQVAGADALVPGRDPGLPRRRP